MPPTAPRPRHLPNSPFNAAREAARIPVMHFEVGERVTHDRHGLGRVTGFDGEAAIYVDFGGDRRRVSLPTTKLHRL